MSKKKRYILWTFLCVCIFILFLYYIEKTKENNGIVEGGKMVYNISDFDEIIVGESTYKELSLIAPTESIQITSYGGICKYPMDSSKYICIKLYGDKLVVGDIYIENLSDK